VDVGAQPEKVVDLLEVHLPLKPTNKSFRGDPFPPAKHPHRPKSSGFSV